MDEDLGGRPRGKIHRVKSDKNSLLDENRLTRHKTPPPGRAPPERASEFVVRPRLCRRWPGVVVTLDRLSTGDLTPSARYYFFLWQVFVSQSWTTLVASQSSRL